MLMCNEQYSYVGPIELLCIINRTPDVILNLLQSTITPIHDVIMYYNGKWNIPRQGGFLGYSFTGTNPIRFGIPSGCSMDKLKDLIKQVAHIEVPLMEFTNHNLLDGCSFDNQGMLIIQKLFSKLHYLHPIGRKSGLATPTYVLEVFFF